jgi:hypothetical protein
MFGLQYDKIEWAVGALLVAAMAFAAFAYPGSIRFRAEARKFHRQ